jgi:hypothetical protein
MAKGEKAGTVAGVGMAGEVGTAKARMARGFGRILAPLGAA